MVNVGLDLVRSAVFVMESCVGIWSLSAVLESEDFCAFGVCGKCRPLTASRLVNISFVCGKVLCFWLRAALGLVSIFLGGWIACCACCDTAFGRLGNGDI
jgi:hypothetical protein